MCTRPEVDTKTLDSETETEAFINHSYLDHPRSGQCDTVRGLRYYSEISIPINCCKLCNINRLATFSRYVAYLTAELAGM